MKKKCVCCKKEIENMMGNQKYCTNCKLFTQNLRAKLVGYKCKYYKLNKIIYGQKNGNERIRFKAN